MDLLSQFHPIVRDWFTGRFGTPTSAQAASWPDIIGRHDTLVSAPTGSGKTLCAFLVAIDRLLRKAEAGALTDEVDVIYVSPLKALAGDIHRNLEQPLREMGDLAASRGLGDLGIRVATRTGDTTPAERREMITRPPHILVTTPESLYLMLTAAKSRAILGTADTLIVDEIHTMLRDKRGSHFAITAARLDHVCRNRPVRIGLSATQKPIELTARFLVGSDCVAPDGAPHCRIVDIGHARELDLAIETPDTEFQAVCSHDQWGDIHEKIAGLVEQHDTTLIFVNTRKLSERIAHKLRERLGEDCVGAHHGSLSKERRQTLEARLKEGELDALVATASLELGIDIGSVDLVCQIESPRSIATFLQRVGRSGHTLGKTPKGRLFPTTRDELVECAALVRAVRGGRLDALEPPRAPLDVLCQQIVAEACCEKWNDDDLFRLMRQAVPYAKLSRVTFDEIVELASSGMPAGSGRGNMHLHRDRINKTVRGRRGARQAAIEGGGTIPEVADYRVLTDPGDTLVGTVEEDFAIESQAGDVFLLGTTSWRIRRIEQGVVRVVDAEGALPTIPFWFGEAPGRTPELSGEISGLRREVERRLDDPDEARRALAEQCFLSGAAADEIVRYVSGQKTAIGVIPTDKDVVFERFFDESGGMQLVVHAPFGSRINKAWGLALRKKFCRNFNFELQAAAGEDAFLLSIGAGHSFAIEELFRFVQSGNVREALEQAILPTPMFNTRWRWNATRALMLIRQKYGKRVPPPIQRMRSEDLLASAFPTAVACQEHVHGPIEIPDHPLVRQTVEDCLQEAMDIAGLIDILQKVERGEIRLHARDTTEPSPFTHEILNSKPYTFLDDAPLEERRARAVTIRRTLPESASDLGALDPAVIARVSKEAWPDPRNEDEVHEALLGLVVLRPDDAPDWKENVHGLVEAGRASCLRLPAGDRLWCATESLRIVEAAWPEGELDPPLSLPRSIDPGVQSRDTALVETVRGQIAALGPVTAGELATRCHLPESAIAIAIGALESEGQLLRGSFRPDIEGEEVCDRRLLARIHRFTLDALRREIEPVSVQDYLRFLLRWQRLDSDTRLSGKEGVLEVVTQLQGFEIPAVSWEKEILPARVRGYTAGWLDELCLSGQLAWARLSLRRGVSGGGRPMPTSATRIGFGRRTDLPWLLAGIRGDETPSTPDHGMGRLLFELFQTRGALFFDDIVARGLGLPTEVEHGLWELVAQGHISADSYQALRRLMNPPRRARYFRRRRRIRPAGGVLPAGRWAFVPAAEEGSTEEELAELWAEQLLHRYGVVFRDLLAREKVTVPWRAIVRALRRFEARGTVRGGRFVTGVYGEQYARPEAVDALRRMRRCEKSGETIEVSAVDPVNLAGIVTPGKRVPAIHTKRVIFVDGLPGTRGDVGDGVAGGRDSNRS